jgi:hypothetical protein
VRGGDNREPVLAIAGKDALSAKSVVSLDKETAGLGHCETSAREGGDKRSTAQQLGIGLRRLGLRDGQASQGPATVAFHRSTNTPGLLPA